MSDFYTNVARRGNQILLRGYLNGKRYKGKYDFQPRLFIPTSKETKFKTIHGNPVSERVFDSPDDLRDFVARYKDIDNFDYFGQEDISIQYIHENFRDVKFDPKLIRVCYIDIEVDTEGGYPDMDTANKEITAITMMYNDVTFALGYGDYVPDKDSIKYIRCKNEPDLLRKFLKIWTSATYCPDVVSGWNIEFFDIPY
ncbi:MAG: 3'-5' exonuclease, partial [Desulfobulbia bacterium]